MGNLLYIIAVVLIIGWLLGFFAFHAGNLIHGLLVVALIIIVEYASCLGSYYLLQKVVLFRFENRRRMK